MATFSSENSDEALLDFLRRSGSATIAEMTRQTSVTSNAVRHRLTRLMSQGLVGREVEREAGNSRGRPVHRYSLTEKARRQSGTNFADLAIVLWQEIRSVPDVEVRRGLFQRIAEALARRCSGQIRGDTLEERMESLKGLFGERRVPMSVSQQAGKDGQHALPILHVDDCPYPQLAEQDRGICAVEKMLFSQLLEEDVQLTQCRLDGHNGCQFQTA